MAFGDYASNGAGTDAGSTTSSSTTFPNTTVSGNTIIVVVRRGGSTATVTVTDNKGNSYTQDATTQQTTDGHGDFVFRCSNISGGASHQITITFSVSATMRYCIEEYVGNFALHGTPPSAIGSGTALDSGAQVTTATCALIGGLTDANNGVGSTLTAGSGWTMRHTAGVNQGVGAQDQAGAKAAGTYNATATFSVSTDWAAILCAYSDATQRAALLGTPDGHTGQVQMQSLLAT